MRKALGPASGPVGPARAHGTGSVLDEATGGEDQVHVMSDKHHGGKVFGRDVQTLLRPMSIVLAELISKPLCEALTFRPLDPVSAVTGGVPAPRSACTSTLACLRMVATAHFLPMMEDRRRVYYMVYIS